MTPQIDPSPARAPFVAVEGGDGAGKTTQIALLARGLELAGTPHLVTREPGGSRLGVRLRELLLHGDAVGARAEALLFAADRAQHVDEVILPALDRGEVVVTDRYVDSSVAYQGAGRDLRADDVLALSRFATGGLTPDLTVLLDVDPGTGRARRGDVHDRMESEADEFHARVADVFRQRAAADPGRYLVLNAREPVERIAARVREAVRSLGVRVVDVDPAEGGRP